MQRNTQAELLRKYQGKDNSINLHRALRRAAAFGTNEDVLKLIELGADVLASGEDGRTALHHAILKKKVDITETLIRHGSSLTKLDKTGTSPAMLAAESDDVAIQRYGVNVLNPLLSQTIFLNILPFLDLASLFSIRRVSHDMNNESKIHEKRYVERLSVEHQTLLKALPKPLRRIIYRRMFPIFYKEKIEMLFSILKLNPQQRRASYEAATHQKLDKKLSDKELTDTAVCSLVFNILPEPDLIAKRKFNNPYALCFVDEKLLTVEEFKQFRHSGSIYGPHDDLNALFCDNGSKLLRRKLVTSTNAPYIQNLRDLVSDEGVRLLEKHLITADLMAAICKKFYHFNMSALAKPSVMAAFEDESISFKSFSPDNPEHVDIAIKIYQNIELLSAEPSRKILKSNLLSIDTMVQLKGLTKLNVGFLYILLNDDLIPSDSVKDIPDLTNLLTENGVSLLREGIFTWRQILNFKNLQPLLTDQGLKAIRENVITYPELLQLATLSENNHNPKTVNNIKFILSESGIKGLREGLYTTQDAMQYSLEVISTPAGLQALRDKVMTLKTASEVPIYNLEVLSTSGFTALKEKLISHEVACKLSSQQLRILLSDAGLTALRENLISAESISNTHINPEILGVLLSDQGLKALKKKLFTVEQISKFRSSRTFQTLLTEVGFNALTEGLISIEDAALFYHSGSAYGASDNLHVLLNPIGLVALRKKLITVSEATCITELERLLDVANPDIIQAMELKLIVPNDFKYRGRFSTWGPNRPRDVVQLTKQLISEHSAKTPPVFPKSDDKTQFALQLQQLSRGYLARKKFGLFREITSLLQSGNITLHQIKDLNNIVKLSEKGLSISAQEKLNALKVKK